MLDYLQKLAKQQRLPHALLLVTEHVKLLKDFAAWLLCIEKKNTNQACGVCKSCVLYTHNTHPDFCYLQPEDGKQIKIDQIRSLFSFIIRTIEFENSYKVVIIDLLESMNIQAANAFLKTLEEPPSAKTIFLLASNHVQLLPETIVSRCQKIYLQSEKILNKNINNFWQYTEKDRNLLDDLYSIWINKQQTCLDVASKWCSQPSQEVLYSLWKLVASIIRCLYFQEIDIKLSIKLKVLREQRPVKIYWQLLKSIEAANRFLVKGHQPNFQLLLEDFIIGWQKGETSYGG